MSTPLIAIAKIVFEYTIAGQNHKYQPWVDAASDGSGGFTMRNRDGDESTNWQDYAGQWITDFAGVAPSDTTGAVVATLYIAPSIGAVFNPVDSFSQSITPSVLIHRDAQQVTAVMVDTSFHRIRLTLEDMPYTGPLKFHAPPTGLAGGLDTFLAKYTAAGAAPLDPFNWVVSRNNGYLQNSPYRGVSIYPNRKVARARGV